MSSRSAQACVVFVSSLLFAASVEAAPRGDTDGDGKLALAEFQTQLKTRVMKADKDADGKISLEEWTSRPAAAKSKGDPAKAFNRLDANSDGALDETELDEMAKKRFGRRDANSDGMITEEEQAARPAAADDKK